MHAGGAGRGDDLVAIQGAKAGDVLGDRALDKLDVLGYRYPM
jgi:outer membrane lipoprotein SlyB